VTGAWIALGGALLSTAFAQLAYKLHFVRSAGWLWLGTALVLFVGASGFAYLALKSLTIGMVYMSTALTQLLVAGLSRWVLREPIGADHAVALGLIVTGIVVYAG
jgi:drug/metabolite transporter (DMT)-like permease